MPTTEERLAALEKQMAAWIDQQPTNYYTHQYSGEEIDNAVARALPNGAIDQAVGTFVRPNLLDNWYFGRPVDQRGGMLQLAGTMLYSDAACTQAMFPSTKTTSIIKVSDIAAHPSDDSTVYVKLADCVRGYTGNVYTVDRWKMQLDIGIILLEADGIILDATANALTLVQFFESDLLRELAGNTLTWSVMYTILEQSGAPGGLVYTIPGNYYAQAIMSGDVGKLCVASGSISAPTNLEIPAQMYIPKGCKIKLIAAKLELGPTQTLAHREGDRWVMNEVPEYGEQLRRCQRYYYRLKADSSYMRFGITQPYTDTSAGVFVQLMSTMRTKPVVSYGGNFALFDGSRFYPVTLAQDTTSAYNTVLKANGTGLPGSSAQLLANADTNAYIDFSADL